MWIIGAGIAIAGLMSMVFAGILVGLVVRALGAVLMVLGEWSEVQAERKRNEWRRAYPSYKY